MGLPTGQDRQDNQYLVMILKNGQDISYIILIITGSFTLKSGMKLLQYPLCLAVV